MLNRVGVIAGSVSTLLLVSTATAFAGDGWGNIDCSQTSYAGCQLWAGKGNQSGQRPDSPTPPIGGSSQGTQEGSGSSGSLSDSPEIPLQGDHIIGGVDPNRANCRYVLSDYQVPPGGAMPVAYHRPSTSGAVSVIPAVYRPTSPSFSVRFAQRQPGASGAWYVYKCSGEGWIDPLYRPPVWIPDGQAPPGAPAPSPQQVAQQAYEQLRLPSLKIHTNPSGTQLVNLSTWLWLDSAEWEPRTATASVAGVSITATATPRSVTWSMGDGSTVTCTGPGTPFPPGGDPAAASPSCGHTYRRSSHGQPGNSFAVTATVHWTVEWSGAGESGTFPKLTTISNTSITVAESQALNTN